jgi:hypothetical protein
MILSLLGLWWGGMGGDGMGGDGMGCRLFNMMVRVEHVGRIVWQWMGAL